MKTKYMSLERLAARLGLPRRYVRKLAKDGEIPALNVGGRLRFNEDAVRAALKQIAASASKGRGQAND